MVQNQKHLIDCSTGLEILCNNNFGLGNRCPKTNSQGGKSQKEKGSECGGLGMQGGSEGVVYIHVKPAQTKTACFLGQTSPTSSSKINK